MRRLAPGARVAVLGGGASGLSFAAAMRERGARDVVVFERETRVGGKSCTVDLDGRPHDLGATMGVPLDYEGVLRLSRRAGIRTVAFPAQRHHSLAHGGRVRLNRWREMPGVLAGAARYLALHATTWRGADGTGLHRAPAHLYRPFSELVDRHRLHLVSRRTLTYRAGYGYGFDDEIAAVMYANLLRPTTFLGLALGGALMWEGGTQAIWSAVAAGLDVRAGAGVDRIERRRDEVIVHAGGAAERFDAVVLTCDPRDALRVLDATPEERGWFGEVASYPYATFACEVRDLASGRAEVGYLAENMSRERFGHPMAWVKRYPDQDIHVFHLFAPGTMTDAEVTERIAGDVRRLGARFVGLRAARRWRFFPHFRSSFMQRGGLAAIERWQGTTRTYLIGEALSFASMARVVELATRLAARLVPGTQSAAPLGQRTLRQ